MMSEYTLLWGLIHQEKTNSQRDVVETGFLAVPFLFWLYLFQSLRTLALGMDFLLEAPS